jgi:hypothetical protein
MEYPLIPCYLWIICNLSLQMKMDTYMEERNCVAMDEGNHRIQKKIVCSPYLAQMTKVIK